MRLRPVLDTDLPFLFDHQRDPEANRMAHFPPRDRDAFFTHWRTTVLGTATSIVKTIDVAGDVAGYVASWQPADGTREVGYWLGRAHWARGIATAALRAFLAEHDTSRPLVAVVAVPNQASRRVLEKCGFMPHGEIVTAPDGVLEMVLRLA